jgi:hypothetical protein
MKKFSDFINDKEVFFIELASNNGISFIEVTCESKLTKLELEKYCNDNFIRSCSCSHDCCGCVFTSSIWVMLKGIYKQDDYYEVSYIIQINEARNY